MKKIQTVLSFDVGLRNLGAAVVRSRPDWMFPRVFTSPSETTDEFKARAFSDFLKHGWELVRWRVFDVTETLDRPSAVKNVKRLNVVSKTVALTDTLAELEAAWFPDDGAPDTVVTEVQHNGNADMRAVCMGILVFFRRSMPDTALVAVSGSHKLKVCAALGVGEGAGLAAKRPRRMKVTAAAAAKSSASKSKYDDNKRRAILAVDVLLAALPLASLDAAMVSAMDLRTKKDDLADALLQALWVLWGAVAPKPPVKPRVCKKRAAAAGVDDAHTATDPPKRVRSASRPTPCQEIDLTDD